MPGGGRGLPWHPALLSCCAGAGGAAGREGDPGGGEQKPPHRDHPWPLSQTPTAPNLLLILQGVREGLPRAPAVALRLSACLCHPPWYVWGVGGHHGPLSLPVPTLPHPAETGRGLPHTAAVGTSRARWAGTAAVSGQDLARPCRAPSRGMSQAGSKAAPSQQSSKQTNPRSRREAAPQGSCSPGQQGLARTGTGAGAATGFTGGDGDLSTSSFDFSLLLPKGGMAPSRPAAPPAAEADCTDHSALAPSTLCPCVQCRRGGIALVLRVRTGDRDTRAAWAQGGAGGGVAVLWQCPCPRNVLLLGWGSESS